MPLRGDLLEAALLADQTATVLTEVATQLQAAELVTEATMLRLLAMQWITRALERVQAQLVVEGYGEQTPPRGTKISRRQ